MLACCTTPARATAANHAFLYDFSVKEEELPVLLETCREPVEMLVELTSEFIRM